MLKEYRAKSTIGVTINLPKGGTRRVSFSGNSEGKSVFYTDDKDVQDALEHHSLFGTLFRLVGASNVVEESPADMEETPHEEQPDDQGGEDIIHLPFVNLSDAKDYLADRFGVSRTRIRTREDVKRYAAQNGVVFDGIGD